MPCFACACEMYWKSSSISLRKEGHVVLTSSPLNWQQRFARPFVLVLSGCRVAEAPVSVGKTVQHGCDGWIPVLCFRQNDPKDIARWLMLLTLLSEWPWHQKWAANISEPIRKRPLKRVQTPGRLASKAGSLEDLEEGRRPLQNFHHIVALLIQIHAPIRFKVFQKWDFLNHALTSFDNLTKKKPPEPRATNWEGNPAYRHRWCDVVVRKRACYGTCQISCSTSPAINPSVIGSLEGINHPMAQIGVTCKYPMQNPSALEKSWKIQIPKSKIQAARLRMPNTERRGTNPKIENPSKSRIQTAFWIFWMAKTVWMAKTGVEVTSMISRAPSGRKHRNSN